jgi:P-type Cu+ transporter
MHPEIVRDKPGSCPICGMALEPRVVTLEERNPELADMTRRFRWSLVLTVPILAVMVSELIPGRPLHRLLPQGWLNWIELALASPVVLWGGWPFFQRGWASVVSRHLNSVPLVWPAVESDDCGGDELQFSVGDRKRGAVAHRSRPLN